MEPREPILTALGNAITAIDTGMTGEQDLNAVYFIAGSEPTLIETGPGADGPVVRSALSRLGVAPEDLAHLVVTHIHIDHAGGAGALLHAFPRSTLWAHERGVPHLVDPTRLVASTARTYGPARMEAFFGHTAPVPSGRVRSIVDGDTISLGDRSLSVVHTPGHASHHVAFHDDGSGAVFTGEAIGSYLPWGPAFRPALPPPEVDVDQALASIDRIASLSPTALLTSHFGPVASGDDACSLAKETISRWSDAVRSRLFEEPDITAEALTEGLTVLALDRFQEEAGRPLGADIARYDALGSIAMNANGLARYWRKRWEAENTGG